MEVLWHKLYALKQRHRSKNDKRSKKFSCIWLIGQLFPQESARQWSEGEFSQKEKTSTAAKQHMLENDSKMQ